MTAFIGRREFITLLGGAAAAWPVAARAQQAERMRRIGVLMNTAADDTVFQTRLGAFLQGLALLGWSIGRNVQIEIRWSGGKADDARRYAAELARWRRTYYGVSSVRPLLQATPTVPIVFLIASDPVGAGLVDSVARPGGNATGFMSFEYTLSGKWLELLKEIAPGVTRVAVLQDPTQGPRSQRVCRHTGGGAVARGGSNASQRARRARDRPRRRRLRANLERWSDRDRERVVERSSQADHHACGPAQTACDLLRTLLRRWRRPDLLWV